MLLHLILLFALVPFLELMLLLRAAEAIGVVETLMLCLVTGAIGGTLARNEGVAVWNQLREQMTKATAPGRAVVEAFLVFAGGLLLLTPGIMTDVFGFAMVLPWTRRAIAAQVVHRLTESLKAGVIQGGVVGPDGVFRAMGRGATHAAHPSQGYAGPTTEDGYRVRVVENQPARGDDEPWQDTETPGLRRLN